MLERVDRPASLTDLAYAQLRSSLLSGAMLADERLSVVALAERLGMSRSPVRAAIERLAAEGLVHLQAGGVSLVRPTHQELVQLLEVRAVLEGLSARLAASRLDDADLDRLETVHSRFEEAVAGDDVHRARALDLDFHRAVMGGAANPVLVEELERLQSRVIVGTYTVAWTPQQHRAVDEHRSILDALRARDAPLAEREAVRHMTQLIARIEDAAP